MKLPGSVPQQIMSLWSFTVIKKWISNYSEKPARFRDILRDHQIHSDANFVFRLQPLHLVSDLSNKWHTKWLVTVFTLPSLLTLTTLRSQPVWQNFNTKTFTENSETFILSIFPQVSKWYWKFFFLCLQCNRKICFYLETIQKSSLFLECEITGEGFFLKGSEVSIM